LGKTYRPTGPKLLSPHHLAESFGKVVGRQVRYVDGPIWLVPKVLRSVGIPDYQIVQLFTYFEEYRRNAFAVGAPTNAVLEVAGQEPEDFETIARRYMAQLPKGKRSLSSLSHSLVSLIKIIATPGLNPQKYTIHQELAPLRGPASLGSL
jgi:NAD(P)H dehydrogenase (quinone)